MTIVTVGIDLAKSVFAIHGVDEHGKAVLVKPRVSRSKLLEILAALPPCVIGMEACSGAHNWARELQKYGHTIRLIAPKFVKPYRTGGKNDAADAAAICEAVTRPHMRFVPIKSIEQQATLCLHRTRQGFVVERTATYNRIRGLLTEFGVVLSRSPRLLRREIGQHLEQLPGWANRCVGDLLAHVDALEKRLVEYDHAINESVRHDVRAKRLMQLPGVGPTTASALLATLGAAQEFTNGRQLAAWIGLTPRQHSSGGKTQLGSITKAGDPYLRNLLVLGARAVVGHLSGKQDGFSRWVRSLVERRGYWRAVVAIAAKNARLLWAALHLGEAFKLHSPRVEK
jgi:transposase